MTQTSLLEYITTTAVNQAGDNAEVNWYRNAYQAIRHLVDTKTRFTADDVWELLDKKNSSTHEPRALGAVIRQAIKDKLIVHTGQYVKSLRPACHRRPISVYESLWQS